MDTFIGVQVFNFTYDGLGDIASFEYCPVRKHPVSGLYADYASKDGYEVGTPSVDAMLEDNCATWLGETE